VLQEWALEAGLAVPGAIDQTHQAQVGCGRAKFRVVHVAVDADWGGGKEVGVAGGHAVSQGHLTVLRGCVRLQRVLLHEGPGGGSSGVRRVGGSFRLVLTGGLSPVQVESYGCCRCQDDQPTCNFYQAISELASVHIYICVLIVIVCKFNHDPC
jgi:hypothetical protein